MAHAEPDAEVRIGSVDRIEPSDIERVKAHRVVLAGRDHSRELLAPCLVLGPHGGRRRPGRAVLLPLDLGHPVLRCVPAELPDADGEHHDGAAVLRIVVKAHLGGVDDDALMYSVRKDELVRDDERGALLRRQRVNPGVCLEHVAQAELVP